MKATLDLAAMGPGPVSAIGAPVGEQAEGGEFQLALVAYLPPAGAGETWPRATDRSSEAQYLVERTRPTDDQAGERSAEAEPPSAPADLDAPAGSLGLVPPPPHGWPSLAMLPRLEMPNPPADREGRGSISPRTLSPLAHGGGTPAAREGIDAPRGALPRQAADQGDCTSAASGSEDSSWSLPVHRRTDPVPLTPPLSLRLTPEPVGGTNGGLAAAVGALAPSTGSLPPDRTGDGRASAATVAREVVVRPGERRSLLTIDLGHTLADRRRADSSSETPTASGPSSSSPTLGPAEPAAIESAGDDLGVAHIGLPSPPRSSIGSRMVLHAPVSPSDPALVADSWGGDPSPDPEDAPGAPNPQFDSLADQAGPTRPATARGGAMNLARSPDGAPWSRSTLRILSTAVPEPSVREPVDGVDRIARELPLTTQVAEPAPTGWDVELRQHLAPLPARPGTDAPEHSAHGDNPAAPRGRPDSHEASLLHGATARGREGPAHRAPSEAAQHLAPTAVEAVAYSTSYAPHPPMPSLPSSLRRVDVPARSTPSNAPHAPMPSLAAAPGAPAVFRPAPEPPIAPSAALASIEPPLAAQPPPPAVDAISPPPGSTGEARATSSTPEEGTAAGADQGRAAPPDAPPHADGPSGGLQATDALARQVPLPPRVATSAAGASSVLHMAPPLDVQLEAGLDQALRLDRRGVHFALQPDGLGPVHLRIVRDEGSVRIHIAVEQAPTRDLVEATWPQLARACEERGVPVDRLVVELVDPSSHGANFSQSSGLPYSQRQRAPEPSTPRAPRPPVEPPHPPAELRPLVGEIHHVDYHV